MGFQPTWMYMTETMRSDGSFAVLHRVYASTGVREDPEAMQTLELLKRILEARQAVNKVKYQLDMTGNRHHETLIKPPKVASVYGKVYRELVRGNILRWCTVIEGATLTTFQQ